MAVNPFFQKTAAVEQGLFQSLVTDCIKVMGRDVYYLPRTLQKEDLIFGEDVLSKFTEAIPIEMYMMKDNWEGSQDMLSKFGLQLVDQVQFTVSKPRWEEDVADVYGSIMKNSSRPCEGDLIYDTMTKSLYEITDVSKERPYYQLGTNFFYVLSCDMFVYSNEDLDTGVTEIDSIETDNSYDLLSFQTLQEDGGILLQESGHSLILEEAAESPVQQVVDVSDKFDEQSKEINWDSSNPFADF